MKSGEPQTINRHLHQSSPAQDGKRPNRPQEPLYLLQWVRVPVGSTGFFRTDIVQQYCFSLSMFYYCSHDALSCLPISICIDNLSHTLVSLCIVQQMRGLVNNALTD